MNNFVDNESYILSARRAKAAKVVQCCRGAKITADLLSRADEAQWRELAQRAGIIPARKRPQEPSPEVRELVMQMLLPPIVRRQQSPVNPPPAEPRQTVSSIVDEVRETLAKHQKKCLGCPTCDTFKKVIAADDLRRRADEREKAFENF